jgi:hypothetical protein
MKYELTATIPNVQYGNIIPKVELEGDNLEELHATAMKHISGVWDKYGEVPMRVNEGISNKIKTFTGEEIMYNDETHIYTDLQGNRLISGSYYKKQFEKPFPADIIIPKVAKKYNVKAEDVKSMWKANGNISRTFGDTIHYAMEQWYKYKDSACDDKQYNLPKHPYLRNLVESFPLKDKEVLPEVMVSDVKNKMVGQIDGILVTGKNKCKLIDYKSDADVEKNLVPHFNQLSFYAHILMNHGWTVESVEVWNYIDKWVKHESKVLDLKK